MLPPLAHLCLSIYLYIFLKQAVTHVVIDRYTNNCIEQTDDRQRNVGGIRDLNFVSLCIFFFVEKYQDCDGAGSHIRHPLLRHLLQAEAPGDKDTGGV